MAAEKLVSLAQIQESLSIVQKSAIQFLNIIVEYSHGASLTICDSLAFFVLLFLLLIFVGLCFSVVVRSLWRYGAEHSSRTVLWHLHNRDARKCVQPCALCSREEGVDITVQRVWTTISAKIVFRIQILLLAILVH